MRFLLKQSSSIAANRCRATQIPVSTSKVVASTTDENTSSGKAWGQQCSPNCGCVLRIETQLSECSSKASPTIVHATYHAKRVMATTTTVPKTGIGNGNNDGNVAQLKPLTTQQGASRPILTPCTCPTLHHLAQQTVDYLPGKSLAQIRNSIDMGMVGARSSVAFRHTVLRENVLPAIAAANNKLSLPTKSAAMQQLDSNANEVVNKDGKSNGAHEMNSTHPHGQCYDLVEDSLFSLIHEQMLNPRKDRDAESYSPTLGGYFGIYSHFRRNQPLVDNAVGVDDIHRNENEGENELSSFHDVEDWQRESPSTSFLFGDASNSQNTGDNPSSLTRLLLQQMKESILGIESSKPTIDDANNEGGRPTNTYLQLLDMYGAGNSNENAKETAMDDWLEYVDYQGNQSNAG